MVCPKEIFAEMYRLNMLLGPQCKTSEAKAAFQRYEEALYELRQQIEHDMKVNECKVIVDD